MYMKVLTTSTDPQTLSVIPRSYPSSVTLKLRDDSTNDTVTYSNVTSTNTVDIYDEYVVQQFINRVQADGGTFEYNDELLFVTYTSETGYLAFSNAFSLVEGRFYDLTILDGLNVIYKDKVFCTDQDIDQDLNDYYSVNKDVYVSEDSRDNEFIII